MKSARLLMAVLLVAACTTVGVQRDEGGFAKIKPTIAHSMILDNQQVLVIDFRPPSEYWGPLGHIGGALNVPLGTIEQRLPELLPYQGTTVIAYGDTNDESRRGARILSAAGFNNVVLIEGGIRAWIDLGYKTVKQP